MSMWSKLAEVERRYEEIGIRITTPEVISDRALFQKLSKEHKDLTQLVATYRAYKKAEEEVKGAREIMDQEKDSELLAEAKAELGLLQGELAGLEEQLKMLLLPKDPNDEKNVIVEIRAGAGGDESGIFAGDIFRMLTRYADTRGWRVDILSIAHGSAGGYKEVIAMINGSGAYSRLKYESGVHRVQRVPKTETAGRIHTSTVTVAVLPEMEDVEVHIEDKDLKIDVYRAGGPGGQSVNTTDSAVRITHIPSGLVVAMQDEKSQHKNREKALRVLRSRLFDLKQQEADDARQAERRSQLGTGMRAEKVRTYNFPQSRITDHRIGLTIQAIDQIMNGDLDQLIDPLIAHHQAEALKNASVTGDEIN